MSFEKARDLVQLAMLATTRHGGVSLEDIEQEFGVSHRTAQRMTQALEITFTGVEMYEGADRRRYWTVKAPNLAALDPQDDAALEALDMAVRGARDDGRQIHMRALMRLRDKYLMHLPRRVALRAEADAEAFLSAVDREVRPGPQVRLLPGVAQAVREAVRGPFRLKITYSDMETETLVVEPHGVLLGSRMYLVARLPEGGTMRHFRVDKLLRAECLSESFALQSGFSVREHAARAFGSYHDEGEFGEVVWRFAPRAAPVASTYQFHPGQVLEPQDDGSLIVRFLASGWLEMTWFLYKWGDAVEVLGPEGLAAMTRDWRRSDFAHFP